MTKNAQQQKIKTQTFFGSEWREMAKDSLKNAKSTNNVALDRLQSLIQNAPASSDIGCYSRMHHRHNR